MARAASGDRTKVLPSGVARATRPSAMRAVCDVASGAAPPQERGDPLARDAGPCRELPGIERQHRVAQRFENLAGTVPFGGLLEQRALVGRRRHIQVGDGPLIGGGEQRLLLGMHKGASLLSRARVTRMGLGKYRVPYSALLLLLRGSSAAVICRPRVSEPQPPRRPTDDSCVQ